MENKNIKKEKKINRSIEKAIEKNIPVKWITQPLSITMMRADLTSMQVKLIVEMIDQFQAVLLRQIKQREEEEEKHPSLFTKEEEADGNPYKVRFPLKDLDVRADAYDELCTAAKKLQAMQMTVPVERDGESKLAIFSLFSRIEIPTSNKEYEYKNGKRRTGYIEMTMDKEAYNDVMRIGRQYTKYIKSVTRNCKYSYTSRIYMFISTYKTFGKWVVPYMELHKMLGFSIEEKGEKIFYKYPLFSDFKRRVLDPSMNELKKMSERGTVDCFFDYVPIYAPGKTRGLPEKIEFKIYSTDLGKELSCENKYQSELIELQQYLKANLHQTSANWLKLKELLSEENINDFFRYAKKLHSWCSNPANGVKDIKSYCWQSLKDWLESHTPVAVEIKHEESKCNSSDSIKEEPKKHSYTVEDELLWEKFLKSLKNEIGEKNFQQTFEPIVLLGRNEDLWIIGTPTIVLSEIIQDMYSAAISKVLPDTLGSNCTIKYKAYNE